MPGPALTQRLTSHLNANSYFYNISSQVGLALISCGLYALVLLVYLRPTCFKMDSLIDPLSTGPSPQVVISIAIAILTATTNAWTTRSVEHYFWLGLAKPVNQYKGIKLGEVERLAKWTVSPLHRTLYIFNRDHLTVRVGISTQPFSQKLI